MDNDLQTTHEILDHSLRLLPWLIGAIVSIILVAIRNEWTTQRIKQAIFDQDGDLRLMKSADCESCRQHCQEAIAKAFADARVNAERERTEIKEDILRIHTKIDDLPMRIITLLRGTPEPK